MHKHIQDRWVENLESGKYPKGKGVLRSKTGFCCLGVLTDMYMQENDDLQWVNMGRSFDVDYAAPDRTRFSDGTNFWGAELNTLLPAVVREWAGISDGETLIHDHCHDSLSRINDRSDTFEPVIERIKEL